MSNSPASLGVQAKWGFGAVNPVTQAAELGPGGDQLKATKQRVETGGLRGTRQHYQETTGDGMIVIAGDVEIIPTYTVLAAILQNILGGTPASGVYPVAETIPTFYVASDRGAKVFTYTGVKVAKTVLSVAQGQALKCVLSLVAQTETVGAAGSFPAIAYPTDGPFMWSSGVFTFLGAARSVKDATITLDNGLVTDRYNNSQTAQQFPESDLKVSVAATLPFTADEVDLYTAAMSASAAGTIVFTDDDAAGGPGAHAAHTLTCAFGILDWPQETPVVAGRAEIPSKVNFTARRTALGTPADCVKITLV